MITRFAPTPSGYCHRGNAANALLAHWLAAAAGGTLALRIDDGDNARARPEYVADIFDLLAWLGVDWQLGPTDADDLAGRWSARHRVPHHRAELAAAVDRGLPVYACTCSRSTQRGPATGGCAGGCRDRALPYEPGRTVLRVQVPVGTTLDVPGPGGRVVDLAAELGDVVLWRRDDLPAYQLASVLDDRDLGVTDVVRGVDLVASSALQLHLAAYLTADRFTAARFWHHGLLAAPDGGKLSKSQHTTGTPLPRTPAEREAISSIAEGLGAPLGIGPA